MLLFRTDFQMVMAESLTKTIMDIQVRTRNSFNILPKFRGSPVSKEEKKRLDQLGGEILRKSEFDFDEGKDYDWITKGVDHHEGIVHKGYAHYYLVKSWNELKQINEAYASVYRQLVEIDSKLGTSISMQLSCCLAWTTRWDIIKV